jgi:SAM-dependent methyltransferase
MAIVGGNLGYRMLRAISPGEPNFMNGAAYTGRSKVETLLGHQVWEQVRNKTVIDLGCGPGLEAIEIAQRGAGHVCGIDILDRWLEMARVEAARVRCENVSFQRAPSAKVDVVVSIDAFEHFADPPAILKSMAEMLKPDGYALLSFGPTWFHPLGGHLFSVFPWAHLIFSEESLCRWRSHIRSDGARRFCEVEGGLNQMTIRRFEQLVESSPFRVEQLEAIPIRAARLLHNRLTREFFTAVVRCKLRPQFSPSRTIQAGGELPLGVTTAS